MPDYAIDVVVAAQPVADVTALGLQGPAGPQGEPGPPGPAGEPGSDASGDVVGPASATDNAVAVFNGTTGKLIDAAPDGTIGGSLAIGSDPATTGALRLPNNRYIRARNPANSDDITLLRATEYGGVDVGGFGSGYTQLATGGGLSLGAQDAATHGFTWGVASSKAFLPEGDNTQDLGRENLRVRTVHTGTAVAVGTNPAQSGAIRLANNQAITARNAGQFGDINLVKLDDGNNLYIGDSSVAVIVPAAPFYFQTYLNLNTQALVMAERGTPPAAPAANQANVWLQDNGSGKSQLMIQFATGAAIAIATQV